MPQHRQGSMDLGTPFIIVALLIGIAVGNYWTALSLWLRMSALVLIGLFLIAGMAMLIGGFQGMGHQCSLDTDEDNEDQS